MIIVTVLLIYHSGKQLNDLKENTKTLCGEFF